MKNLNVVLRSLGVAIILMAPFATKASDFETKGSGFCRQSCSRDNPRCLFDFETKNGAKSCARANAKSDAEMSCISSNGIFKSGTAGNTTCTKITSWVDYYVCNSSFKATCEKTDINPSRPRGSECFTDLVKNGVDPVKAKKYCLVSRFYKYGNELNKCTSAFILKSTSAETAVTLCMISILFDRSTDKLIDCSTELETFGLGKHSSAKSCSSIIAYGVSPSALTRCTSEIMTLGINIKNATASCFLTFARNIEGMNTDALARCIQVTSSDLSSKEKTTKCLADLTIFPAKNESLNQALTKLLSTLEISFLP